MSEILKDLSTPALTEAITANLYDFFRFLKSSTEAEFVETPHFIRWKSKVPYPLFNGVLVTQEAHPADEASIFDEVSTIEENISYFKTHKVPAFTWWREIGLPASSWDQALLANGFSFSEGPPGMAMDLTTLKPQRHLPADFQIKQVKNLEELLAWMHIVVPVFQFPDSWFSNMYDFFASMGQELPIRNYLGYLEGEPVATATLFLGGGAAGIYDVATLPEARKRGIGTAITVKPLLDAVALGYRAAVLQSSESGFGVYQKLGFEKLSNLSHYIWSGEPDH